MAQPFSYRYPLIDGQGNWGAPDDPKASPRCATPGAAHALRASADFGAGARDGGLATELRRHAQGAAIVPPRACRTYCSTAPPASPSAWRLTSPPHNLREVTAACIRLLELPNTTIPELCRHIRGPDYPTEAEIISPKAEIRQIYETGNGSIRARAKWERENGDIVITALPHQVSPAKVLEQIAQQMNQKKLPMIEDLRDESDHEQRHAS